MELRYFQKIEPEKCDSENILYSEFDPEGRVDFKVGGGASICIFIEREQDAAESILSMEPYEAVELRNALTRQIAAWRKSSYTIKKKEEHPWVKYAADVQIGDKVEVYNLIETPEQEEDLSTLKGVVLQRFENADCDFLSVHPLFLVELESGKKMVSRYLKIRK